MVFEKVIDEIDKQIIDLLQHDSTLTHSKIAKKLGRSQPAIGARVKKLTEKGILATQIGVNFQQLTELNLVKVELKTARVKDILELCQHCPYILNALKTSGDYNFTIFLASSSLKKIDKILDRHFREKDYVSRLKMDLVTDYAKKFVLPMNFQAEMYGEDEDPCANHPLCASARKIANLRSPSELNLM